MPSCARVDGGEVGRLRSVRIRPFDLHRMAAQPGGNNRVLTDIRAPKDCTVGVIVGYRVTRMPLSPLRSRG